MAQETLVVALDPRRAAQLRSQLEAAGYTLEGAPHAAFRARGPGLVATLYSSGKLVVQGQEAQIFLARFAAEAPSAATRQQSPASAGHRDLLDSTIVGSDECGKGDYFGPLVVASVRLSPQEIRELSQSSVRDSKELNDEQCLRLGAALRGRYAHAIELLNPSDYNSTYQRPGQLNQILADLHAKAVMRLTEPGMRVLIDKFADESLLTKRLRDARVELHQRVRAESHPAVAAASIIAREQFLTSLKQLSENEGVDLAKGAGSPVDQAARRFVQIHGAQALRRVAKMHFKNTQKLGLG